MSRVYVLGAGASYAYTRSPTGVRPPLARGFFKAFQELDLSADAEVPIGAIVNYVRDYLEVPFEQFGELDQDIETFLTELDQRLRALGRDRNPEARRERLEGLHVFQGYGQTVFLLGLILNDICNGPPSEQYRELVARMREDEVFITFNWDTLLDRALWITGRWQPDHGYGVRFGAVMDDDWRSVSAAPATSGPKLLKLHGSLSWLINYMAHSPSTGERTVLVPKRDDGRESTLFSMQPVFTAEGLRFEPQVTRDVPHSTVPLASLGPEDLTPHCFFRARHPYATYKNRYRPGYAPFTYFFPPNLPGGEVLTMPLIVPPTKYKPYDEFGHVLEPLWGEARRAVAEADEVVVIGYSFPPTDTRAAGLFDATASAVGPDRRIEIVNPSPESAIATLTSVAHVPTDRVSHVARSFDEYLEHLA